MTGTEQSCVSNDRLEQLIGSGTPNSREIHDMAVELLISRRAALTASASEPAPPCECMFPRDCNGSCELPRQATHTDDAHPIVVLADVLRCAEVWEPEVRIIGNVRAGDIVRAIRSWPTTASTSPVPASEPEPVAWRWRSDLFQEWQVSAEKPGDRAEMERRTCLNMQGLEVQGLAPTGSVPTPDGAVEARQTLRDILREFHRDSCYPEAMYFEIDDAIDKIAALSNPADGWRDIESAPTGWGNFFFVRPCGMHHSGKPFLPTIVQFVDGEFYTPENELDPVYFGQNEPEDSPLKSTLEWFPIPQGWITTAPAAKAEGE